MKEGIVDHSLFLLVPNFAIDDLDLSDTEGKVHTLVVGDETLYYFPNTQDGKNLHISLVDNCIPFNKAYFHDTGDHWPSTFHAIRFDSDGTRTIKWNLGHWQAELYEVYMRLLRPHINDARLCQRAVMTIVGFDDFTHQQQNALLHRTRKLLGDPDCGAD